MLTRIIPGAAMLLILAAGAAQAIEAPSSKPACFALYEQLAQAAENKELDQQTINKVGQLLASLNGQCDADELGAAGRTATELVSLLERN